jgi:hypothetical protein
LFLQLPHAYTNKIREAKISNINKPVLRDAVTACCGYSLGNQQAWGNEKVQWYRTAGTASLNTTPQTQPRSGVYTLKVFGFYLTMPGLAFSIEHRF